MAATDGFISLRVVPHLLYMTAIGTVVITSIKVTMDETNHCFALCRGGWTQSKFYVTESCLDNIPDIVLAMYVHCSNVWLPVWLQESVQPADLSSCLSLQLVSKLGPVFERTIPAWPVLTVRLRLMEFHIRGIKNWNIFHRFI